jgi:hypothetical protein
MRDPLQRTPIPPSLPAIFHARSAAWRDEASGGNPGCGEILRQAGIVVAIKLLVALAVNLVLLATLGR